MRKIFRRTRETKKKIFFWRSITFEDCVCQSFFHILFKFQYRTMKFDKFNWYFFNGNWELWLLQNFVFFLNFKFHFKVLHILTLITINCAFIHLIISLYFLFFFSLNFPFFFFSFTLIFANLLSCIIIAMSSHCSLPRSTFVVHINRFST